MKTLREYWKAFYSHRERELSLLYPGLQLERFLMEVKDLLQKKNPLINLDHAVQSISVKFQCDMEGKFLQGIPFGYLLGQAEFYGLNLNVTKDVLVPRPETEQLVDHIVKSNKIFETGLDVGTGSGAIILSLLAQGVIKKGVAVDLSPDALKVAESNAKRLRLNCDFLLSDRLNNVQGKFHLIVSNPPYIKMNSHSHLVQKTVDQFEPPMALYLQDVDYASWFESFFQQVYDQLQPEGMFYMEGHELEVLEQTKVMTRIGFKEVQMLTDYGNLNRFLVAKR